MTAPPAADPPFRHVGIVGAGLIGGSIALAIRRASGAVRITVVDRPDVAAQVMAAGAADATADALDSMASIDSIASIASIAPPDLIVLATPVPAILAALSTARVPAGAIITDVGSTKRQIVAAAAQAGLASFVGGHPMAGRERGGFAYARSDLFDGRPWFLVTAGASPSAVSKLRTFVVSLGARPVDCDATTHDRTMAYVSHLPQIVSSMLMRQVDAAVGRQGLESAGRGLEDVTRLAGSPSEVWEGILASNADFVGEAASEFASALAALGGALGSAEEVRRIFTEARRARDQWHVARRVE